MALPSKTIELIEQIAERLERWAKSWGKRLLKNKPHNLRQFRQSLLVEFESSDLPQVAFKMEFNSGLNKALEGFGSVLERLYRHMPNMAPIVQKKHKRFVTEAKSTCQLPSGDQIWFKKFNNSRDIAIDLAKTLRHIAEMAREDLLLATQKNKRRSKNKPKKSRAINKRFSFRHGQVLFDDHDLNVGAGVALDIIKALVKDFGYVVSFQKLDENSPKREASEKIRTAIRRLRKTIKSAGIPVVIENRKAEGYIMLPLTK